MQGPAFLGVLAIHLTITAMKIVRRNIREQASVWPGTQERVVVYMGNNNILSTMQL